MALAKTVKTTADIVRFICERLSKDWNIDCEERTGHVRTDFSNRIRAEHEFVLTVSLYKPVYVFVMMRAPTLAKLATRIEQGLWSLIEAEFLKHAKKWQRPDRPDALEDVVRALPAPARPALPACDQKQLPAPRQLALPYHGATQ